MVTEEKILELIREICGKDLTVTRDSEFVKDLGILKSVAYYELAAVLEEECGISVSFYDLKKLKTVGEAVDFIRAAAERA